MATKSAAERREALRQRIAHDKKTKDQGGKGSSLYSVMDYSSLAEKYGEVSFFKPKTGRDRNMIDIMPWVITQEWYRKLRKPKTKEAIGLTVGMSDRKLEIPIHKNIGPDGKSFVCLFRAFGKACPICEELAMEYKKPKNERNEKKISSLTPSWRDFYNVYDYNDPDKGIQIWEEVSWANFEKKLWNEACQAEAEMFADPIEGKTLDVKLNDEEKNFDGKPVKFPVLGDVNFIEREPYDENIDEQMISLDQFVKIPTYDDVQNAHLGLDEGDGDGDDDKKKEEEKPANPRRFQRTAPEVSKSSDANKCIGGGTFGADCNNLKECGSECPEEVFQACAAELERLESEKAKPEPPKEESKPDPPPRRSVSRRAATSDQTKTEPPAQRAARPPLRKRT